MVNIFVSASITSVKLSFLITLIAKHSRAELIDDEATQIISSSAAHGTFKGRRVLFVRLHGVVSFTEDRKKVTFKIFCSKLNFEAECSTHAPTNKKGLAGT